MKTSKLVTTAILLTVNRNWKIRQFIHINWHEILKLQTIVIWKEQALQPLNWTRQLVPPEVKRKGTFGSTMFKPKVPKAKKSNLKLELTTLMCSTKLLIQFLVATFNFKALNTGKKIILRKKNWYLLVQIWASISKFQVCTILRDTFFFLQNWNYTLSEWQFSTFEIVQNQFWEI